MVAVSVLTTLSRTVPMLLPLESTWDIGAVVVATLTLAGTVIVMTVTTTGIGVIATHTRAAMIAMKGTVITTEGTTGTGATAAARPAAAARPLGRPLLPHTSPLQARAHTAA